MGEKQKFKHEPFEAWLAEKCVKQKCTSVFYHPEFRYKVDLTCKRHPPFPKGRCNKCVPENAVLAR
jgi:hypothetical protein